MAKAQEVLRESGTRVVCRLDRLGRSISQLLDVPGALHRQGIAFRRLSQAIDASAVSGRFFFRIMASLAQMARALAAERTRAGRQRLASPNARGRKSRMTGSKMASARELLASGVPPKDAARRLGALVPSLYRWVPASARTRAFFQPLRK